MIMLLRFIKFQIILTIALLGNTYSIAQSADNQGSILVKSNDEDRPKSIKESLYKMRIAQEKKEYQEMLDRGDEALKLAEDLESAVERSGKLTERDMVKIASVEKLVKKIRSELGGDDEDIDDAGPDRNLRLSPVEAVKSLKSTTISLTNELKKTSRFTISAAAIQSTNAVLRIVRIVRFSK